MRIIFDFYEIFYQFLMISIIFLSLYFTNSFSLSNKLVRLSALDVTQKLEQSPKSIVFVSDDEELIKFAYPAIEKYKDQVQFLLTSPDQVPSSFYTTNPSIIPFEFTKPLKIDSPPLDSASFSYWVERIIDPTHYNIALPIQLIKILDGSIPALFEINKCDTETKKVENGLTIFKTTSSLFQKFNIKVNTGLYVYRPQDRQLIPYNGSFALQSFSRLTHFSLIDPNSTKIILAFVVDEWGNKTTKQYELLENLSYIYGCDKYYYTLVDIPKAQKLFKGTAIHEIKKPIFIMCDISSSFPRKWIYNSTEDSNFETLKEFVSEVISNKKTPTIISEPVPDYNSSNNSVIQRIVNSNFADFVYDDTWETVVMFEQDGNMKCKLFLQLYKAIAKILGSKYTRFYIFDVTKNDIPPEVPEVTYYPMVMMWPAGMKDQPKVFSGEYNFQGIMKFIKECASHKLSVAKFDTNQILQSINEKVNKLKKKEPTEVNNEL